MGKGKGLTVINRCDPFSPAFSLSWSTGGIGQVGIPGVAISGRKVAEVVTKSLYKKWKYPIIKT